MQVTGFVMVTLAVGAWLSGGDDDLAAAVVLVALVAVAIGYPVVIETLWHGRSLGKAAFGLRVVRDL